MLAHPHPHPHPHPADNDTRQHHNIQAPRRLLSSHVATGLMAGFIYLPQTTRLAVDTLAVLTGADVLQFGYSWLQEREQT